MFVRQGILLLPLLVLAACQSPGPTDFVAPRPIASTPAPPPPNANTLPNNAKVNLRFTVQPSRSIGHIRTTLDPDGPALGPRSSECSTALRGSINATLTTGAGGSRSILLREVDLQSTSDGRLRYSWTPLIGHIDTTLPAGVLRISNHHIPDAYHLAPDGTFRSQGHRFTVDCVGDIEGHGLVLGKAVGKYRSPLDIPATDPVTVSGSFARHGDGFILRIPNAVLRDNFDLKGASLNLVFRGNITATAPVR